jgi:hypothetical protein
MGSTQLAEEHGDKLAPAGESSGVTFGLGFFHSVLKLDSRKQLQELAKYATEFIHRWPSFICDGISGKKSFHHNIIRGPFLFQNLIWTRMWYDIFVTKEFVNTISITGQREKHL